MRNCWFMALNAFVRTCFLSAFQKSLLFFVNLNLKKSHVNTLFTLKKKH